MNTTSIDIETIISIVAKKHKLILDENDPILVSATLNQLVVKELLEEVNASIDQLRDALEEVYFRQSEENKKHAHRIMNATLNRAKEIITKSVFQASSELTENIKAQQRLLLDEYHQIAAQQRKAQIMTLFFSCAAIAATAISVTVLLVG